MYHSLEAGIGARYKKLWLYGGTGDFLNLNDVMVNPSSVDNLMFRIKDVHFPYFGQVNDAVTTDKLTNCKDTTSDSTAANCPENADLGWYIKLTDQKKLWLNQHFQITLSTIQFINQLVKIIYLVVLEMHLSVLLMQNVEQIFQTGSLVIQTIIKVKNVILLEQGFYQN